MRAITGEEMAAIDANMEYYGLSRLQLMENAAAGLARALRKMLPEGRVVIAAGRGNNGGDGLAAARFLADYDLSVVLLGRASDITTPEARHNMNLLEKAGASVIEIRDSTDLNPGLFEADLIVDALLGTGIRGSVREPERTAIDFINQSGSRVLSVDVPSGFGTDIEVKADHTVTFHRPKVGLSGSYEVVDIGIHPGLEALAGPGDVALVTRRKIKGHKGDHGRVLVIGGGPYTGAPVLTAMAALRAGADIVTLAVPEGIRDIAAGFSPNLIVRPLTSDILVSEDVSIIEEMLPGHDVVVIGMGLGAAPETVQAIESILPVCRKAVVDADALRSLHPPYDGEIIVTPHAGEFNRISGIKVTEEIENRVDGARQYSQMTGMVTLLKGPVDVITDGDIVRLNPTGNPGMTVGGTGDVLAGVVGEFFANYPALRAATAAAFVNGAAGDLAWEQRGGGLIATDVLDKITEVIGIKT